MRRRLEADGDQCLLVFDNAADPGALARFLPAVGRCQVIITTTNHTAAGPGTGVPVDVFTIGEAAAFLAERTGRPAIPARPGWLPTWASCRWPWPRPPRRSLPSTWTTPPT